MARNWTCRICGKPIPVNADPSTYVLQGRFHLHPECANSTKDKDEFFHYCQKLFGDNFDFVKINRLAEGYIKTYKYTWSGMHGSLVYFYDIQKHPIEQSNYSIGIIPYIYNDARKYYQHIEESKKKNAETEYKPKTKVVSIPVPEVSTRPPRIYSMED